MYIFNIETKINNKEFIVTSFLFLVYILFSMLGFEILSLIIVIFLFLKIIKIYLKYIQRIKTLIIDDSRIKLLDSKGKVNFEDSTNDLKFIELKNNLFALESKKIKTIYLDFGHQQKEIKSLIGENKFIKPIDKSKFGLDTILDIFDLLR